MRKSRDTHIGVFHHKRKEEKWGKSRTLKRKIAYLSLQQLRSPEERRKGALRV